MNPEVAEELNQESWRPNPQMWTWLAAAFGLAIILGAAFVTGFLKWPAAKPPVTKKATPETTVATRINPPSNSQSTPKLNRDAASGELAVAKLWAGIEAKKLAKITNEWKAPELAPVLMRMRPDQVAELLAEMAPDRASAVSREIQRISSL